MIFKSRVKHGSTRSYWAKYYQNKFEQNGTDDTLHLATWYLILFEAFGDEEE